MSSPDDTLQMREKRNGAVVRIKGLKAMGFLMLFVMMLTKSEFGVGAVGPAISLALRLLATALLLAGIWSNYGAPRKTAIQVAAAAALVFIAISSADFGPFVLLGASGVFLGLALSEVVNRHATGWMVRACRGFLIINVALLVLSVTLYFTGAGFVDIHAYVFPWSGARQGLFIGIPRFAGLQVEPGTYANIVYITVVMSALARRQVIGTVEFVAVISTLATGSVWAIVGLAAYIVACFSEVIVSPKSALSLRIRIAYVVSLGGIMLTILLWVLAPEQAVYIDYLSARMSTEDGSGSTRLKDEAFEQWQTLLWFEMMFPHTMSDTFCAHCDSPQDLGLGFNIMFHLGLLVSGFLFVPFAFLLIKRFGIRFAVLAAPVFVSKVFYYDPVVWLLVGMVFTARTRSSHGRSGSFRRSGAAYLAHKVV